MTTNNKSQQSNSASPSSSASEYLSCGYLIHDIEKAEARWQCVYCQLVMKEPIQLTECGHRGCRGCFESRAAVAINGKMTCPVEECKCDFDKNDVRTVFLAMLRCNHTLCIFHF
jgi:hypothetical protein